MSIQVGARTIGEVYPPFIIAEVGSNWRTFDDCKNSIVAAKLAGADAVKFQAFTREALYGQASNDISYELPLEWLPKLKEKADACGIEFMCTAFSPELYDAVDPYVRIHKVASAEACHLRILQKLKTFGKPVILSTGAKGQGDIRGALEVLTGKSEWVTAAPNETPHVPVVLMYCVAAYPANEVNLDCMALIRGQYGTLVGYSDHSTDVLSIPALSAARGACVLEKHFTVVPDANTPDRPHSLDTRAFTLMVKSIRREVVPVLGPTPEERAMILRHNRRLIATRDIGPGDVFKEGVNFGIYRSLKDDTSALHPMAADALNGQVAKRKIHAGDGIGPKDVRDADT